MRRLGACAVLLVVGTLGGRTEAAPGAGRVQPMRLIGGMPVLDVRIDGRGPFRFALDTGAEGSAIRTDVAARLGLTPFAAVELVSVAGVRKVPIVKVRGMRLLPDGPEEEVEAAVADLAAMRLEGGLDGVLGSDVLARYDYLLDFGAGTLALSRDGRQLPGGITLPLELHRGRPLVRWPVAGGELTLVLDSGADALVLDREVARTLPLRRCRPASVETNAGEHRTELCELRRLALGGLTLDRLRVVALPWPAHGVRPDSGLLPASLFARVQVSNSRRTVTVWTAADNDEAGVVARRRARAGCGPWMACGGRREAAGQAEPRLRTGARSACP